MFKYSILLTLSPSPYALLIGWVNWWCFPLFLFDALSFSCPILLFVWVFPQISIFLIKIFSILLPFLSILLFFSSILLIFLLGLQLNSSACFYFLSGNWWLHWWTSESFTQRCDCFRFFEFSSWRSFVLWGHVALLFHIYLVSVIKLASPSVWASLWSCLESSLGGLLRKGLISNTAFGGVLLL